MDNDQREKGNVMMIDWNKISAIAAKELKVIPVVVQDIKTKGVLVVAYVDDLALRKTIETGIATFWSTTRDELWVKGRSSGHVFTVQEIRVNCEQNSLLFLVTACAGRGMCHVADPSGIPFHSCFYRCFLNEETLCFVNDREEG